MRSDVYSAERAVLRRLDPDRVGHLRAPESARREPRGSAVDGLAIHEGIAIVTVTAFTLRAFTKLTLRMFVLKTFLLRINVFRSLIRSMNS